MSYNHANGGIAISIGISRYTSQIVVRMCIYAMAAIVCMYVLA